MTGTNSGDWTATTDGAGETTFTHATTAVLGAPGDVNANATTLGTPTGGTITANGATLTADGANGFDIDDATISASALASQLTNGDAIDIDYDGAGGDPAVTYTIGASGEVSVGVDQQYVQGDGSLGAEDESETTTTYHAHANGNVTSATGQQVYQNGDGDLSFDAETSGARTDNALSVLDGALSKVDTLRSDLGAIQNRFESAITNLATTATNLTSARSRIEDADYAKEVSNMTRAQILQQAGTSVLAQANQIPQNVLSLLR